MTAAAILHLIIIVLQFPFCLSEFIYISQLVRVSRFNYSTYIYIKEILSCFPN
jgi:hypothetical protein